MRVLMGIVIAVVGCTGGIGPMGDPGAMGAMGEPGPQGSAGTIDPSLAILNGTTPQTANFNIDGTGVINGAAFVGGKLGIGTTTTPIARVEVDIADGAEAFEIKNVSTATSWVTRLQGDGTTPNNLHFDFSSAPDAMMLRSSGQLAVKDSIAIGSSGAISGNWWEFGLDDGVTGTGIDFHGGTTLTDYTARIYRLAGDNGAMVFDQRGSSPLLLQTNDANRVAILANGNVGIGTTTPAYALDVNGNVNLGGIHPFLKGGNNGTVSCDTFCMGAQWGQVGVCTGGGKNTVNGVYQTCATNLGVSTAGVVCLCSSF